jgi:hypothetical protein
MMKPEPNVQRLAQELAEQNKAFPREQRHWPRQHKLITLEAYSAVATIETIAEAAATFRG